MIVILCPESHWGILERLEDLYLYHMPTIILYFTLKLQKMQNINKISGRAISEILTFFKEKFK